MKHPIVLCILDGVGISAVQNNNAVMAASMPFYKSLLKKYPHTELNASGAAVGLPLRTMGNSEVGHITIGAGRVVNQFLRRFAAQNWDKNQPLKKFITDIKKSKGNVHLVGLMSDGRVHSDINEIIFIGKKIIESGLPLKIHFIADGRDTKPGTAKKFFNMLRRQLPSAEILTVMGRYYAMDRNNNLDRTELAYKTIVGLAVPPLWRGAPKGRGGFFDNESDEFITPTRVTCHVSRISKNDGIIFANYRSDRARQILRMLLKTGAKILGFSQYGEGLDEKIPALLPDIPIKNTLGDVLAKNGLRQLRIAETEKYNHVTYFFDAERTIDFAQEEKILIPSPNVKTFDMKPEMAANEITRALLPRLKDFDVVILNYANGDMVGHTGNFGAAIKAMECLDKQLSKLVPAVLKLGGTILITADHGNAENMNLTSHTTNKVPFIIVAERLSPPSWGGVPPKAGRGGLIKGGGLSDIAPTILKLLGIKQPGEMTGNSLINN